MEAILSFFENLEIPFDTYWKTALLLFAGTFLLALVGRLLFGKQSVLNKAISSAIGVLFVYAVTVVLNSLGGQFSQFVAPLPFVNIVGDRLVLFPFLDAHYTAICSEVLSMIILAFLVNLADSWLPKGKKLFSWIFYRCLTIVIGLLMHIIVVGLLTRYLPEALVLYAPVVLLVILVLLLLTGVLKILVGLILVAVNPILAAIYTFFFASFVGKQITKAVLTAAILAGIVLLLQYLGIHAILLSQAAVTGYIPFAVLLPVLWYLVSKVF